MDSERFKIFLFYHECNQLTPECQQDWLHKEYGFCNNLLSKNLTTDKFRKTLQYQLISTSIANSTWSSNIHNPKTLLQPWDNCLPNGHEGMHDKNWIIHYYQDFPDSAAISVEEIDYSNILHYQNGDDTNQVKGFHLADMKKSRYRHSSLTTLIRLFMQSLLFSSKYNLEKLNQITRILARAIFRYLWCWRHRQHKTSRQI
jgi:hypothetical protein